MKKLLLEEDDVIQQQPADSGVIAGLISQMIRSEWDAVDLYSSMLLNLEQEHRDDLIDIINGIVVDHYANIGQLEKALQMFNDNADYIDAGRDETEDALES